MGTSTGGHWAKSTEGPLRGQCKCWDKEWYSSLGYTDYGRYILDPEILKSFLALTSDFAKATVFSMFSRCWELTLGEVTHTCPPAPGQV